MGTRFVGQSVTRKEGREKVTGRARYVDDLDFPGMLHGVTVRSTCARGRILDIRFDPSVPWDEIVVVSARDIPGHNYIQLLTTDQPCLADGVVNHAEEPVLLLAHRDRHVVENARRHVHIDYEQMKPVFDVDEATGGSEVIWGDDNIFKALLIEKGDVDLAFAEADLIVEGDYSTGAQEHVYIEPNGVVATARPGEEVTVWGSLQCPFYVHKALVPVFGLPPEQVRVIQTETGGAFGGKEEYPSMIAAHAALLAWKSGSPVKIVYDRMEDMVATTKRHPSRTRHRTAVSKDGRLLAMDIDFVIDGGAYMTLSPVVLSRGSLHASGPYFCPNVRVRGRAVATNHPPHGAFRGFGAPQSLFAVERQMNKVAASVGLAPDELRRRNFLQTDQTMATGQVVREQLDLTALMTRALTESDFHEKAARFRAENEGSRIRRGIGFAAFMHGAGFTGAGEKYLASVVGVEATEHGRVRVLSASTEMGQGTNTVFAQIVADALGLEYDDIDIAQPDTKYVPNSGPTVASRTVMIVGKLLESAALGLRSQLITAGLLTDGYSRGDWAHACSESISQFGPLRSYSQYQQPAEINWDEDKYRGDAYPAYSWAVHVAEVSVDAVTYEVRVEDFVAIQEVGRVVNPVLASGQIEGGVAQAIGYALYENVVWKDGRMANNSMTNYIIPTSADVPPIRVFFEEVPSRFGPGGAKGIGELPMDGAAPAILNAVESALGRPFDRVPLLPEDVELAMEGGDE